jgi:thioesterase domain-containing protein/acyl carrier protein
VLSAHPAVVSCAVVARGDRNGRHLVAHVVPKDTPFDIENVRAHLANKLPDYMCPRLFVVREQLPLSANGKIDRQSLAREAPDTPRPAAGRRAARNQTERRLCGLWAAVLGVSDVGVTDDFFELGGDSLSAVRLIARVEAEFGRRLPLSALLRGGTVEALSAVVGHATDQPDTPLIAIQPEGDRPPLVLVHPVGGHVLCYAPLAQRLGSNQPVYGLESIGLESDASPLTSIEEMASCYLAALRHLPAQRPLFLGGWSLGGVVAFEMCRQLQAAGHEVAGLLLVDSWAPGTFDGVTDEIQLHAAFCDELSRSSGRALRIDERDLVPHDRDARLDCILQTAREANALPNEIGRDALARLLTVFMTNMRALAAYRSAPTEVPALVVRAAIQRPGGPPDTVLGWSAFCGAVDAAEIAGDHHAVFDDVNLRPLVERIQRWIERTAAASRRVSR